MKDRPILVVGLNPVIQKTLLFDRLTEGEVNRTSRHRLDASGKGMNVARVLAQLGVSTLHVTHAGGLFRDIFLRMARQEGIGLLCADSGSEIRQCVSSSTKKQHVVTEIVENRNPWVRRRMRTSDPCSPMPSGRSPRSPSAAPRPRDTGRTSSPGWYGNLYPKGRSSSLT